jgi:hypothetical protein
VRRVTTKIETKVINICHVRMVDNSAQFLYLPIGINNDLTTGQTGITLGTTNDETARGLDVVGGVLEELSGDDGVNDVLLDGLTEVLGLDVLRVLDRDDNGVNAKGNESTVLVLVLNGDLGLGIRTQPTEGTVATEVSHLSVQLVGKSNSEGHVFRSLISGITKHDTLVTSTNILNVEGLLDETLSNIRGLLLDGNKDVTGLVVETLGRIIITNLLDGVTNDLLVVKLSLGGDFTKDHDHTSLGGSLTSDLGKGILGQAGIENSVRDLIANLV